MTNLKKLYAVLALSLSVTLGVSQAADRVTGETFALRSPVLATQAMDNLLLRKLR